MIKKIILSLIILSGFESKAQVGINTTAPKAQLEIKSSNETTPANTDGLLIPKINAFPVTNPTADQQGMLVYLTTTVGANTPGFYFWNNPTTAWLPVKGTDGGTLDQAYDFGGAGNGRTITADNGAVTINGTDGLVVTGTSGSGAVAPNGAGVKMFWNPRKAAFRAGNVSGTQWDDANIGTGSVAFSGGTASGTNSFAGSGASAIGTSSFAYGVGSSASGQSSIALGNVSIANGVDAVALGFFSTSSGSKAVSIGSGNTASGGSSTAFGNSTTASGFNSTTFGSSNVASGDISTSFGRSNTAFSFGETVLGIGATTYTPSSNGATQFRTANATDRLFVIGNAIDANNNNTVDTAERSDAMVVLKNGNVGVGISTPQNKLHFHNQTGFETFMQLTNSVTGSAATDGVVLGNTVAGGEAGIVNQENSNFYLFSGLAGEGQLTIGGNGNVGIGTFAIGAPPQAKFHVLGSIRMEDGSQGAGKVLISDANGTATWTTPGAGTAGTLDHSYDFGGAGNGRTITADSGAIIINGTDGLVVTGTSGSGALSPSGAGTRMVWNPNKEAFRAGTVTGNRWDDTNIGIGSIAFGFNTVASGSDSSAFGSVSTASGSTSTAFGSSTTASGSTSTAFGSFNIASGSTSTAFGNSTNAIGLVSTTFGQSTSALGNVSTSFGSENAAFGDNSTSFGKFNLAMSYGETVIGIGATSYTPSTNGETQFRAANATDRLFVIGNAIDTDNDNNVDVAERSDAMVVLKNGNTGIGVSAPGERLQVAGRALFTNGFSVDNAALIYRNDTDYMFLGPQSGSSANGAAIALFGSTNTAGGNAGGVDFNVPGSQVRMNHTNGSYVFRANSTSGYAATFELNDVGLQIGHNSASRDVVFNTASTERMRLTAVGRVGIGTTVPGGQFELSLNEGRKPGSNAWTIVSDQRLKNVNGVFTKGLNEIIQLNPIRYHYKNSGERKFEQQVLSTEFTGFLAQEVQQIFPEAVGTDADGYLNFDLHPILVAYTNAFKELDLKNQAAENKNRELELKLQSQEQIINSLIERLEKLEAKN